VETSIYNMKQFSGEIEKLFERLQSGEKFSFSKYADGEWMAMCGLQVNNGEFESTQNTTQAVMKLRDSFEYKDDGYYVGVSCPCCQGEHHKNMILASGQDDNHLTFANIFVNGNYKFFKENFIPEFSNHKVHLIANENAKIENLPFEVEKFYPIGFSAWVNNYNLIDEIVSSDPKDKLFLFCAGPFGNILAHRLWAENKKNIYMDIGSTLNPFLESEGFKRGYFSGPNYEKMCVWGE
jgi:hypothetical protein